MLRRTIKEEDWDRVKAGRIPEASVWSPVLSHPRFSSRELPRGSSSPVLGITKRDGTWASVSRAPGGPSWVFG